MHAARLLPPPDVTLAIRVASDATLLERFELALEESIGEVLAQAGDAPLAEHVRWHFGLGGTTARHGKRLRPRLLLAVARAEGGSVADAIDAALAIELLHNYSLVHDDIEDGDELRHGRPTVWARYGTAHGINAGDSMCAVSYLTLLRNSCGAPAGRVAAMMRVLHAANLAMCAGQSYDIGFEGAAAVSMDGYLAMIEGKTAVLFGAACTLGALAAGTDERRAGCYDQLGRAYGRAFQIRDDILNTWAPREATGKARGTDIARRKWSFPIVWALAGPPSDARDAIAARYAAATPLGAREIATIVDALDALGARPAAETACAEQMATADRLAARHQLDGHAAIRELFADAAAALN